jgi:hypothetical protein
MLVVTFFFTGCFFSVAALWQHFFGHSVQSCLAEANKLMVQKNTSV